MAPEKDQGPLKAKVETEKAMQAKNKAETDELQRKINKLSYDMIGIRKDAEYKREQQNKLSRKQVELAVDLQQKKRILLEAQYMALKSKNLKKLADVKLKKEVKEKAEQMQVMSIGQQQQLVAVLQSEQAKKLAEDSLKKKEDKLKELRKGIAEVTKQVETTKKAMDKNELQ